MKSFINKTAVITGGASGIGLGLAKKCLREGMNVVIADVEQKALKAAEKELGGGKHVLTVKTDVSKAAQMDRLAEATFERFGSVHLLVNNAGVSGDGCLWELTTEDWEWTLGVNLWGVIHGLRVFSKHIVEQNEGHIVNTASIAGLMSAPGVAPYTVSKHSVVAMSECLHGELRNAGKDVGVSVLCPSFVKTKIYDSHRNRKFKDISEEKRAELDAITEMGEQVFETAMPTEAVADLVFDAIRKKRFYILTHPKGSKQQVQQRMEQIINDGLPSVRGAEDYPFE